MNHFIRPELRPSWLVLQRLSETKPAHLRELLNDTQRHQRLQFNAAGLRLDASYQCVNVEVMQALMGLAEDSGVLPQAHAMFSGEKINVTEDRAVLHVALRGSTQQDPPWGKDISAGVAAELERYCRFAEQLRAGECLGFQG
ncbi:MAG: glucose-6-phosphate isomerase, partial [Betaproteobacteria bacterium]|nr:glucose-6-phosphate isomerase [Betaproteobacteria bacterium]